MAVAPEPIRVEEQYDEEGDLVYVLRVLTYDRRAIDRMAEVFSSPVEFIPPDAPHEGDDWRDAFRSAEQVV